MVILPVKICIWLGNILTAILYTVVSLKFCISMQKILLRDMDKATDGIDLVSLGTVL